MNFRVLSYNVHKGIGGVDRQYNPQRIIDVVRSFNPEIVFLQEVDDGVPRSGHDKQVELFGDALGMPHRAYQGNVRVKSGEYGNAILSRFPLSNIEDLDLTLRFKKRRRALIARCTVDESQSAKVMLANCHLGLAEFERRIQLRRMLDHIGGSQLPTAGAAGAVVGGDLNDVWSSLDRVVMTPRGYQAAHCWAATFPAIRPLRTLDRIFFDGELRVKNAFVGHSVMARRASDHLPVIVDFEMRLPTANDH